MNEHDVEELMAEVKALRSRVMALEHRPRVRRRWLVAAVVLISSIALADLVIFAPDMPAVASEVNGNFAQLKAWIEAKVGPLNVTAGGPQKVTINGDALIAAPASAGRGLFVTGSAAFGAPIVEARHDNLTQGVGIGWGSVFATGSATDVSLSLSSKGAGKVIVNDLVASTESAYELSCGEASYSSSLNGNPFCCRIHVKTGAVSCIFGNAAATTWGSASAYPGLGATTNGRYHLSCSAGAPGASYPFCCRIDANSGAVTCSQTGTYNFTGPGSPVQLAF